MQKHQEQLSDPWNQGHQENLVDIWAHMRWNQESHFKTQQVHPSGYLDLKIP
jgi:hypothetical protein